MAETTQQEVSAKVEDVNAEVAEFLLTKTGVMIIGSESVGEKLTALLCEAIAMNESCGLSTVVLRSDGYPKEGEDAVFGMTYADTHSVAINLQHCWDRALAVAEEGDKYLSLQGILWVNLLSAIGHELDHVDLAYGDRELYEGMRATEEGNNDLEIAAAETAERLILRLALKYDVEMPAISEMPFFATRWMALHTDDTTKDLEWVVKARKMAEESTVYAEPENDIKIKTFREFVKQAYDQKDKEDWEQQITPVNLEAHLETGEVITVSAEPVEQPQIEEMELEEEAPVEAVEVSQEVMNGAAAFVGAGAVEGAVDVDTDALEGNSLEVPLPAPVAEQKAQVANAAATAVPPAPTPVPTYTPNDLTPEVMAATMKAIWQTCYHHIFTKCGWQQNPQTGRYGFTNAAAVLEGINVQHIISQMGADNFIMEYDTLDADGRFGPEQFQGMLRGHLTSKQGLPCYELYLNIGGQRVKRTFMPQNPDKIVNNAYTKSADDAAVGNMIAWIFKGEVSDAAPFKEKCSVKIRNNEYEVF